MKKQYLLSMIVLFTACSVYGQNGIFELKGGALFPQGTETGIIIGLGYGRMLDENIGWTFEADYFWRTYTKETTVKIDPGMATETTIATEIENSTKMLPVMAQLIYLTKIAPNLDLRLSAGLGYAFLRNTEANYLIDVEKSNFYSGFAWQIGGGISIPISRTADFYGELNYFSSNPSKDAGETASGLPQYTEIDMSGLMVRVGVRIYN